MEVPPEYHGREQTYMKHRVLKLYLEGWAMKLGSFQERIWFVDCFAGPWKSRAGDRFDTSFAIWLRALYEAAAVWSEKRDVEPAAVFVEKERASFEALEVYAQHHRGRIEAHTLQGSFGAQVPRIQELIGHDAAFLFVDPTGWKGTGMRLIAPLARERHRDVRPHQPFQGR